MEERGASQRSIQVMAAQGDWPRQSPRTEDGKSPFRRSNKSGELPSPFPRKSQDEIPVYQEPPRPAAQPEKERKGSKGLTEDYDQGESSDAAGRVKRKPAFDREGPVEAVALQSDWQFWNIFSDVRTIGKGHFAKVKQVQHNESHEHFAAKILDKAMADNDIEDLVREFQMLRALRHPNIIRLFAAYETPRKLYLVTEVRAIPRRPPLCSCSCGVRLLTPIAHIPRPPPCAAGNGRRADEATGLRLERLLGGRGA